jgi:tetratricopeptide (TPR) repeat protein
LYDQLIQLDNDNECVYICNKAQVLRKLGRIREAINTFNQALERFQSLGKDRTCDLLYYSLASSYEDIGCYEEAIVAYQKAIEIDPSNGFYYNGLGNTYSDIKRYDDAIANYQEAIKVNPNEAIFNNGLGNAYFNLVDYEKARYYFNERIRLEPDNALNALVFLGILDRIQGTGEGENFLNQALQIYDSAWKLQLQSPAGLLENKAMALLCLGKREEGLKTLRDAMERRLPGDVIELNIYELLRNSPYPPSGIDEMIEILIKAEKPSNAM